MLRECVEFYFEVGDRLVLRLHLLLEGRYKVGGDLGGFPVDLLVLIVLCGDSMQSP